MSKSISKAPSKVSLGSLLIGDEFRYINKFCTYYITEKNKSNCTVKVRTICGRAEKPYLATSYKLPNTTKVQKIS